MELGFVSGYVSMFVIFVRFTNRELMRSHDSWDDTDKSIASQKFELKDVETLFADQSPWLNPRITWWGASSVESGWDGRVWTSFWRGDGSTGLETRWPIKIHQNSYQLVALQKRYCSKVSSPSIFSTSQLKPTVNNYDQLSAPSWRGDRPWQLWCLVAVSFSDSRTASEFHSDGLLLFELGSVAEGTSETFWGVLICQEFQCFVTTKSQRFQNCQFELANAGPLIETKRLSLSTDRYDISYINIYFITHMNSC